MVTHAAAAPRAVAAPLTAVRITAVLSVIVLAWQFVTAGALLPRGGPIGLHATGAIVLHVVLGLLAIAAILWSRAARGPWWPAVLAVVVFVLSFAQAYAGEHGILALHVPCAMLLTVGTVWVAAWSFTSAART
ncbi:hypothetical protein Acsp06_39580 [Actinomycetospora sp. NBRC 106375]|uniref:hypothetical protein n=1 Tax=Actinomycetospora sp. NBRC 106375 TaxID=3032207 RepID=UPI0024A15C54|nr:hypothetical protein [Actinomycetospora sp. NBRC 106375]GLZ47773.1 hypothetical protein Acsp06_39580 [Actinomycetospora sp. NBRC 106375]